MKLLCSQRITHETQSHSSLQEMPTPYVEFSVYSPIPADGATSKQYSWASHLAFFAGVGTRNLNQQAFSDL